MSTHFHTWANSYTRQEKQQPRSTPSRTPSLSLPLSATFFLCLSAMYDRSLPPSLPPSLARYMCAFSRSSLQCVRNLLFAICIQIKAVFCMCLWYTVDLLRDQEYIFLFFFLPSVTQVCDWLTCAFEKCKNHQIKQIKQIKTLHSGFDINTVYVCTALTYVRCGESSLDENQNKEIVSVSTQVTNEASPSVFCRPSVYIYVLKTNKPIIFFCL